MMKCVSLLCEISPSDLKTETGRLTDEVWHLWMGRPEWINEQVRRVNGCTNYFWSKTISKTKKSFVNHRLIERLYKCYCTFLSAYKNVELSVYCMIRIYTTEIFNVSSNQMQNNLYNVCFVFVYRRKVSNEGAQQRFTKTYFKPFCGLESKHYKVGLCNIQ